MDNPVPIYVLEDFFVVENKDNIIDEIIYNKKYQEDSFGISHPIIEDSTGFFANLYTKFYEFCLDKFQFNPSVENKKMCWSYVSDKEQYVELWHNHIHTSTINAVYYLNIPGETSIDFRHNDEIITYVPKENELLIFPNYLYHKPNRCYGDGYRVSINMEIICKESAFEIFNTQLQ